MPRSVSYVLRWGVRKSVFNFYVLVFFVKYFFISLVFYRKLCNALAEISYLTISMTHVTYEIKLSQGCEHRSVLCEVDQFSLRCHDAIKNHPFFVYYVNLVDESNAFLNKKSSSLSYCKIFSNIFTDISNIYLTF